MQEPQKIGALIPGAANELKLQAHINAEAEQAKKIKQELYQAEKGLQNKPKQVYGIAAQYKTQLSKCAFKLIIYWKVKKDGTPYAQHEISSYANLKKIPSIDFDTYKRINHEDAYNALLDKVYNEAHRMFKAILVYCDYFNSQEHWIASFDCTNLVRSTLLPVHFKAKDEYGNIRFDYYEGQPIRLDKMRFYEGR